jgi:hypothetical protein
MISTNDTCVTRHKNTGEAICRALQAEALKLGFDEKALPRIEWSALHFSVKQDPADGSDCLAGEWKDKAGYRVGQVQFNGDGSFFAEHDVVKPHPGDKRWFVEAVEAWGRDSNIMTEPRLLAAL